MRNVQPIADRFEIPVRPLSRWPGAGINRVEAGRARRLVPSAAFFNTGATWPGFGAACVGVAVGLCVLSGLPAGVASCVAKRVAQPVRNREARVTGPHLA
jgi:hypothetical protein